MADAHSIVNLREVEDMAPKFGHDDIQEARFPTKALAAEQVGLSLQFVKPGQRNLAHRHSETEEVFVVLSGRGRVKLDDEIRDVGPMDAIRVAPQVVRAFEAGDEGLEILVFGRRGSDFEMARDFSWDTDPAA